MEELTESARQCLVSQGIVIATISLINSFGLLLTGVVVLTRAKEILHFTSLTHLAVLEIVCGICSFLAIAYICWLVAAYRNRQLEIRSKYLDEKISKALIALICVIVITFSALVVSAVFLMLKTDTSSTYDIKSTMSLYAMDCSRKVIMDKLQILFECCGSTSLLDWFLVDWQNSDPGPGIHMLNGTIMDWDAVPFSCCNPETAPPCVHHQLRAFGVGSLYGSGCADKLDEAVFVFVLGALIMFFISTFLMAVLVYTSRKLQTSARSAFKKGDATATGCWWLLSRSESCNSQVEQCIPLLIKPKVNISKKSAECFYTTKNTTRTPFRKNCSTEIEDWDNKVIFDSESSEDWTRRANDASASTSSTSFLTSTRPINSTPETRQSVSDTAVANLEVSHHYEHKARSLHRS